MFKIVLIGSILAHLAIILPSLSVSPEEPPIEEQKGGQGEEEPNSMSFNIKKFNENADVECPNYYVGIGITLSFMREVQNVADGGPADRAGILVGDVLITDIDTEKLTPGEEIVVDFYRGEVLNSLKIVVDKICKGDSND